MFTFPFSRRQADAPSARHPRACRPLVDSLEGRQLLSTVAAIQGQHIGMNVSEGIVGQHIGMNVREGIVGQHIGMNANIINRHPSVI